MQHRQRNIRFTVLAVVTFIAVSLTLFFSKINAPRELSEQEMQLNGAFVFEQPRIIKPFQLLDQEGNDFGLEQLQGKWSLLFFGFTYCPDICPTTLADLKQFKGLLADTSWAEDTQIVLVSVDPARDTPAALKEYLAYFDPEFTGLTGDFMVLQGLATNLNAAFTKSMAADGKSYLVDHTPNIAVVNPYGHYHGFFKPQATLSDGQFDAGKLKITYQSMRVGFNP